MAQVLWHGRSVRTQLLIVFVLIDVIAALVAGAVTILQARTSTRVEIAASMELAQLLVREAVGLMRQEVPAERFLADLTSQLRLVRHVRIVVKDAAGARLPLRPPVAGADPSRDEQAPAWFTALIAPRVATRDIPVVINGQRIGSVEIVAEPRDEIAEVWTNTVALGAVALAVNVAVIAMLYVLFGRVLDPLTGVARGLADLEQRNYRVRLPRPQARELAAITDRFNALAEALATALAENEKLNHRLITAQDDERRRTALELHDEVGPCLFGLKANAASIATAAAALASEASGQRGNSMNARAGHSPEEGSSARAALPEEVAGKIMTRVRDILGVIEHLQAINRSMLNRLRPMALGHVPLRDLVGEMVQERAHRHPEIEFSFSAATLARGYGDSIDLTVYRCVQESLTNVIRHAQAAHVDVKLGEAADASSLVLVVNDDGRGIDPTTPPGFGISGMQERVQALGGSYKVEGGRDRGTCVRIVIPLPGHT